MSLLHQVLRDIDQRESQAPLIPSLFKYSASAPRGGADRVFAFFAVFTLLAAVFWFAWHATQHPADDAVIAVPAVIAVQPKESIQSTPEAVLQSVPAGGVLPVTAEVKNTPSTLPITPAPVADIPAPRPPLSVQHQPAAPVRVQRERLVMSDKAVVTSSAVVRRSDKSTVAYRAALTALQKKDTAQALDNINAALASDGRDEYRTLKLRILLEQGDAAAFTRFYQQHDSISDAGWLAVAAPGLHMLGHPELAVVPYQNLIVRQPAVANWPLALASAWEAQGKPLPARSVLENTLTHYVLTSAQRQWVQQKIQQLR